MDALLQKIAVWMAADLQRNFKVEYGLDPTGTHKVYTATFVHGEGIDPFSSVDMNEAIRTAAAMAGVK